MTPQSVTVRSTSPDPQVYFDVGPLLGKCELIVIRARISLTPPPPGDDQWHQVLVSGLSLEETCIVGTDVATNEYSAELTAMLDDALLVVHPGTVDDKVNARFQTIEQILTPQNDN